MALLQLSSPSLPGPLIMVEVGLTMPAETTLPDVCEIIYLA
jgi:hypothetical protein